MDTEERLRRHWKIVRDIRERGYAKENVLDQIEKRMDDAKKFIYPQREFADLVISYFTEGDFEVGDAASRPRLKLKIGMDSSIRLEDFIKKVAEEKIEVYWNYADDLKSQYLTLAHPPDKQAIVRIARDIIPNIEELIAQDAVWLDGYRGLIQLIVLVALSEKMKEEGE
jgi:hypothetical protein